MLRLTFNVGAIVYAIMSPVFAFADGFIGIGATGRTSLTTIDLLSLPALTHADSVLAFAVAPAAFGLLELTDLVLVAPLPFGTVGLRGRATPTWVDIEPTFMRSWPLTNSFRIGISASIRYTAAPGFTGRIAALSDIHAVIILDSLWSASCLVTDAVRLGRPFESPLPGPTIHAALARGIGDYVASANIALASGQSIGLLLEVAHTNPTVRWRASFCTAPFTLGGAAAIPLHAWLSVALALSHTEHLGFRTVLGVEFVP